MTHVCKVLIEPSRMYQKATHIIRLEMQGNLNYKVISTVLNKFLWKCGAEKILHFATVTIQQLDKSAFFHGMLQEKARREVCLLKFFAKISINTPLSFLFFFLMPDAE